MIQFNPQSLDHLSCLFFGGRLKTKAVMPVFKSDGEPEVFKTGARKGQIKTHLVDSHTIITGLLDGQGQSYSRPMKKEGFWSTDEGVLNNILRGADADTGVPWKTEEEDIAHQIAGLILEIRGLEKKISTYYTATEDLIYDIDHCVHPQFNHTATETGRLSCKSPNIQNQPSGKVLSHFTSRYK